MEVTQPLDHITHAVIGGGKTIDFGISNSAEFFQILSATLYTDQHLAVVREVLCNAWDAHIESGRTDRPIRITLDNEYLTVRDFGLGIPHDKIGPIYGVYGNSTKKKDERSTGGFGLGCKAPFAYTDHFEVTSFHEGVRSIYNMSKSNAQAMGKPGIITIAQVPTEEFGLLVKIPIQSKDRYRFDELIKRVVANGEMYAYLNNGELERIPFSKTKHGYYLTPRAVMGEKQSHQLLLRYGTVIYPIPEATEIHKLRSEVMEVLRRFDAGYSRSYRLILQAQPDTISVTPSREALSMQEHTITTLNKLFAAFLKHAGGLDNEMLVQSQKLTDEAVIAKDYNSIFSQTWGFDCEKIQRTSEDITDIVGMAHHQLSKSYPKGTQFRTKDVSYRVRKAIEVKVVDTHLADTFLTTMPKFEAIPTKYSFAGRKDRSDWLHRRVLGKVLVKLDKANMDTKALFLIDSMDPSIGYGKGRVIPIHGVSRRHHLINLPYLRKAVVVTAAINTVGDRLQTYSYHNPGAPRDGLLCYHVRSRKAGANEAALKFFTDLGYEVVDLTKRYDWDPKPMYVAPADRTKREPKKFELPALSNIFDGTSYSMKTWRTDEATRVVPEFVLVIASRDVETGTLNGYSTASTKAVAQLYGDRVGVAKDQNEYKWAIRKGAKDFQEFLEEQLQLELLTSPTVAEYFAYAHFRVAEGLNKYSSNTQALELIYKTPELRAEFGLKNNLTDDEVALMKIFQHSTGLSGKCTQPIHDYADTIPLAPENQGAVAAVSDNELIDMINFGYVKSGLKDVKRPVYIDIIIKALKG